MRVQQFYGDVFVLDAVAGAVVHAHAPGADFRQQEIAVTQQPLTKTASRGHKHFPFALLRRSYLFVTSSRSATTQPSISYVRRPRLDLAHLPRLTSDTRN